MKNFKTWAVLYSVILAASGCQTVNTTKNRLPIDEQSTTLSVAGAFLESGRPDKAIYELNGLLERENNNIKAHSLMGLAQLAMKNPTKAIEHLNFVWKAEPTAQNALNLSSAYIETKQFQLAQKLITTALAKKETPPYPNRDRLYHNLGLLAERKSSFVAAEKAYRKALVENPTFYLSRARLAQLLEDRQKFAQAKEQWDIARTSCPSCLDPTVHLVNFYRRQGDHRTALGLVRDYRRLEGLNPTESQKAQDLELELMSITSKTASMSNAKDPNQGVRK